MVSSTDYAAIYRDAAKLVEDGGENFACIAIDVTARSFGRSKYRTEFELLFSPDPGEGDSFPSANGWFGYSLDPDARGARILALCFMAAITERP